VIDREGLSGMHTHTPYITLTGTLPPKPCYMSYQIMKRIVAFLVLIGIPTSAFCDVFGDIASYCSEYENWKLKNPVSLWELIKKRDAVYQSVFDALDSIEDYAEFEKLLEIATKTNKEADPEHLDNNYFYGLSEVLIKRAPLFDQYFRVHNDVWLVTGLMVALEDAERTSIMAINTKC
jgi:hypothetical protein